MSLAYKMNLDLYIDTIWVRANPLDLLQNEEFEWSFFRDHTAFPVQVHNGAATCTSAQVCHGHTPI